MKRDKLHKIIHIIINNSQFIGYSPDCSSCREGTGHCNVFLQFIVSPKIQ